MQDNCVSNSLERINLDLLEDTRFSSQSMNLHKERYLFAAKHLRAGRVLDIACGIGYGTDLILRLKDKLISEIYGVDISEEAIRYARNNYLYPKAKFIQKDATRFADDQGFDTIISLETIEHLPNPERFISHLIEILRPNGVLICSVPTTPSVDVNPYHLHDFTEKSFRRIFKKNNLIEIDNVKQVQAYRIVPVLLRKEKRFQDLRKNLPIYYLQHPFRGLRRISATLIYGFNNHYITIAWTKGGING